MRIEVPAPTADTLWAHKKLGIRDNREFARLDTRDQKTKTYHAISSLFHDMQYGCSFLCKRISAWYNNVQFPQFDDKTPIGTTNSEGLVILFHGLASSPFAFSEHLSHLSKAPRLDVFAPSIPNAGHCSVECDAAKQLLSRVVDWTQRNPGRPIALFGHSNGSRFAVRLETWLRKMAPQTPVHVCLAAGALFGSKKINALTKVFTPEKLAKLTFGYLSPVVCEELAFASPTARSLMSDARRPLAKNVQERKYVMYASTSDHLIPDCGSSIPILNVNSQQRGKSEQHFLVHQCGHHSIVSANAKVQVDECLEWMKQKTRASKFA